MTEDGGRDNDTGRTEKRSTGTGKLLKYMPKELEQRYWIKTYAPGVIIHQKDYELEYFGIIARGEHRVINEFQNGNVFMIEKNEPIDFVGEVTILAGMPKTSVTIETLTETTVFYISRKDFEDWITKDIHFLRLVGEYEKISVNKILL